MRMVSVSRQDGWYLVTLDGQLIGQFTHSLDAHRYAMSMFHDGMAGSVRLLNGTIVD